MEAVVFTLLILLGIYVLIQRSRLRDLQKRVAELEGRFLRLQAGGPPEAQVLKAGISGSGNVSVPEGSAAAMSSPSPGAVQAEVQPRKQPPATRPATGVPAPVAPSPRAETWKRIERQLVENWTGIVGAIILTAGLGFLGLLAALAMSAFFRFLMLASVSGGLIGLSYYLARKTDWKKFSSWIRGVAGAVALFACFGSAAVPGLLWVENQTAGLLLIGLGIGLNLFFAWNSSRQSFASLHLLLSLLTLSILPQELPVFILAAVVSLAGVVFAYRARWEHQALLATASFATYQIYRYFHAGGASADFGMIERSVGICSTAVVGAAALLMHYRRVYADERSTHSYMPLLSHIVHWFATALGFLLYATGSKWNTIVLAIASILCFFLARRGRSLRISWLYRTDTLVAQSLALFALLTLQRWDAEPLLVAAAIFIEILLFVSLMVYEGDAFLEIIGRILHILAGLGIFQVALFQLDYSNPSGLYRNAFSLAVLVVATVFFELRQRRRIIDESPFKEVQTLLRGGKTFSVNEVIGGLLLVAIHASLIRNVWASSVMAAMQAALLYTSRTERNPHNEHLQKDAAEGMKGTYSSWGLLGSLVVSHGIVWFHLFVGEGSSYNAGFVLLAAVPFLVADIFLGFLPAVRFPSSIFRAPGIILGTAHLLVSVLRMANPVTPLLPGTIWLVISVAGLELALWMTRSSKEDLRSTGRLILFAAFSFVLAFLGRHVLVELQTERYAGWVPVRALIQGFAVIVFLYWFFARSTSEEAGRVFWRFVQPLFLEAALILIIVALELEFTQKWMTLVFAILPFALFAVARALLDRQPDVSRLRFYGLILYWVAAFHLAFLSAVSEMPGVHWLDRSWVLGGAGLLLLIAFVPWVYQAGGLDRCWFPASLKGVTAAGSFFQARRNLWIFDPLFISAAFFLYWSFDKAVLTLLWVGLVFAVFSLSILLREGHFRVMALIALAACLGRLLFFDLSQSSLVMRAVVFVGVGLLMLGMNSLYNRFKDRFV